MYCSISIHVSCLDAGRLCTVLLIHGSCHLPACIIAAGGAGTLWKLHKRPGVSGYPGLLDPSKVRCRFCQQTLLRTYNSLVGELLNYLATHCTVVLSSFHCLIAGIGFGLRPFAGASCFHLPAPHRHPHQVDHKSSCCRVRRGWSRITPSWWNNPALA
jgi:hypothetical protein